MTLNFFFVYVPWEFIFLPTNVGGAVVKFFDKVLTHSYWETRKRVIGSTLFANWFVRQK